MGREQVGQLLQECAIFGLKTGALAGASRSATTGRDLGSGTIVDFGAVGSSADTGCSTKAARHSSACSFCASRFLACWILRSISRNTILLRERGWMPEASGSDADPAENRSSNDRGGLSLRTAGPGRDSTTSNELRSVIQAAAPDATATAARTPPASIRMMEFCGATAAGQLSTWRMPSTPAPRRLGHSPPPRGFAEKPAPSWEPK